MLLCAERNEKACLSIHEVPPKVAGQVDTFISCLQTERSVNVSRLPVTRWRQWHRRRPLPSSMVGGHRYSSVPPLRIGNHGNPCWPPHERKEKSTTDDVFTTRRPNGRTRKQNGYRRFRTSDFSCSPVSVVALRRPSSFRIHVRVVYIYVYIDDRIVTRFPLFTGRDWAGKTF